MRNKNQESKTKRIKQYYRVSSKSTMAKGRVVSKGRVILSIRKNQVRNSKNRISQTITNQVKISKIQSQRATSYRRGCRWNRWMRTILNRKGGGYLTRSIKM